MIIPHVRVSVPSGLLPSGFRIKFGMNILSSMWVLHTNFILFFLVLSHINFSFLNIHLNLKFIGPCIIFIVA